MIESEMSKKASQQISYSKEYEKVELSNVKDYLKMFAGMTVLEISFAMHSSWHLIIAGAAGYTILSGISNTNNSAKEMERLRQIDNDLN